MALGNVPPFFINLLVILNNPFKILFDVKTRLSSILLINIFNLKFFLFWRHPPFVPAAEGARFLKEGWCVT